MPSRICDHRGSLGHRRIPAGSLWARNSLQGGFARALAADFDKHGKATILECRERYPDRYLAIIASLMPKTIAERRGFDAMSADQVEDAIAVLDRLVAVGLGNVPIDAIDVVPSIGGRPSADVVALEAAAVELGKGDTGHRK